MISARIARRGCAAILVAMPLSGTGCVFDDIHEELVAVNNNMDETQALLREANATLDEVHDQLKEVQRTNDLLVQLQAGLGTQEIAANASENRASIIRTMESIDRSLGKMDEHMSALRKTIANIDNTIPFLSFSAGPDAPEDEGVEGAVEEGVVEDETIVTPDPQAPAPGPSK